MTYVDVLRLPNRSNTLLTNGQYGRIVAWHHKAETVTVSSGEVLRDIHCHALRVEAGVVIEILGS